MTSTSTHNTVQSQAPVAAKRIVEGIQFFVDNGYLVAPDLVTADELDELKRDIVGLARGKYPCDQLKPLPADTSDADAIKGILNITQPHFVSPVILKYVKHPQICAILSQITAAHLPRWDGSVKCLQSMVFVKPPGFQGHAWHQDEMYIPTRDRSLVGAWIAIDDATAENGCLWVVPGSHQSGYLYPQRDHNNPEEYDEIAGESYGFDGSKAIPVEVKAGSVVFFNGYLLHCSRRNRSNTHRRVLVCHYMNAWSLLPWHAVDSQRKQSAGRADVRAIIPVTGVDPYAWKGIEPNGNVHLRACKANVKP